MRPRWDFYGPCFGAPTQSDTWPSAVSAWAETHGTIPAFRRDRWRDQLLVAAGYRVTRVT
jgi:hypothetical protein